MIIGLKTSNQDSNFQSLTGRDYEALYNDSNTFKPSYGERSMLRGENSTVAIPFAIEFKDSGKVPRLMIGAVTCKGLTKRIHLQTTGQLMDSKEHNSDGSRSFYQLDYSTATNNTQRDWLIELLTLNPFINFCNSLVGYGPLKTDWDLASSMGQTAMADVLMRAFDFWIYRTEARMEFLTDAINRGWALYVYNPSAATDPIKYLEKWDFSYPTVASSSPPGYKNTACDQLWSYSQSMNAQTKGGYMASNSGFQVASFDPSVNIGYVWWSSFGNTQLLVEQNCLPAGLGQVGASTGNTGSGSSAGSSSGSGSTGSTGSTGGGSSNPTQTGAGTTGTGAAKPATYVDVTDNATSGTGSTGSSGSGSSGSTTGTNSGGTGTTGSGSGTTGSGSTTSGGSGANTGSTTSGGSGTTTGSGSGHPAGSDPVITIQYTDDCDLKLPCEPGTYYSKIGPIIVTLCKGKVTVTDCEEGKTVYQKEFVPCVEPVEPCEDMLKRLPKGPYKIVLEGVAPTEFIYQGEDISSPCFPETFETFTKPVQIVRGLPLSGVGAWDDLPARVKIIDGFLVIRPNQPGLEVQITVESESGAKKTHLISKETKLKLDKNMRIKVTQAVRSKRDPSNWLLAGSSILQS